ncbi:hypothetical protein [Myroides indicus]|uniref:Lipoprotein n=1 Tax=Myroides indicus TaxID=1323422 RepID=A0A4R7F3X8_9FLAO|nr:hypothetical protein [Myroides indicus]TDS58199.1 hypothetical protein C8P70_11230 [Myroides indicus]
MKKIYTCAVLSVLLAACSTEAVTEQPVQIQNTVKSTAQSTWTGLITDIENQCTRQSFKTTEELIRYVESAAFANPAFAALAKKGYASPTAAELDEVKHTDVAELIEQMNYSAAAKTYLYRLWVTYEPWTADPITDTALSAAEWELLQILLSYGDDPDDIWDGKRRIALAYGYQMGKARAVVFAVLAGQAVKTH